MTKKSTIQPVLRTPQGSPLSWFQERLWLLNRMNPLDTSWNIPFVFLIEGVLDVRALERSLGFILGRHENLRARFRAAPGGAPFQSWEDPVGVALEIVRATEADVPRLVAENAEHRFDLENGPVLVHKLVHLGPERHLLLLDIHHIVADGWSIEGILFSELQAAYEAFCEGGEPELPELPIQYADFSAWQRKQDLSRHLAHWRDSLRGYEGSLELPTDFPRRPGSGGRSASLLHRYDDRFCKDLDRFSQRHGATLFMTLLAGLAVLAQRYAGRDDVCIGTTTSGRPLPELEGLIGFFINILPLRIRVDEGLTVGEYMAQVRGTTVSGFEHQAAPFERILQALETTDRTKGGELVPLILRHQNFPHTRMDKPLPGGVRFSAWSPGSPGEAPAVAGAAARCEVELSYTGNRDGLQVEAVYAADLFQGPTIRRILGHHEHILKAMFEDDSRLVGDLPTMGADEIRHITVDGNRSLAGRVDVATFVERFATQAQRAPDAVACHDATGATTFGDLARRSNRLAHLLQAHGVVPGDVVGVCLDRGATLLEAILAIWKTGSAYVPVDPSYPEAYRAQILVDAGPKLVLGTIRTLSGLGLEGPNALALDSDAMFLGGQPDTEPTMVTRPESLAYIMYTSGSTGTPKGVRVLHRQLVNWLGGIEANWPFDIDDVVGQKTTIAFAPSVKELFAGLLNGTPQVFLDAATLLDTAAFVDALRARKVTRLNLVPSHLDGVLPYLEKERADLPSLRMCIVAGEPLSGDLVSRFRSVLPRARLINNYGCTELNDITYFDTAEFVSAEGFVPVGLPIQNTRIYLLDARKRLVPDGVPGELHVATSGMPQGYHNLPELDAAQFLPNAFPDGLSDRLFNTGDLARRLPDGNIEYIGRRDFQVKVRGQRVDVRHVEKVLGDFQGIGPRAVVSDGTQLTAYFVAVRGSSVDLDALRLFLGERLPVYMVPSAFVAVDDMPRLPNGKLDRRALKPADGQVLQSRAFEPPATRQERVIASIWAEVLDFSVEEIGRNTHFFEIGGDSLAAARVMGHIHEKLGAEVGMSALFEHLRLSDLAAHAAKVGKTFGWSENASDDADLEAAAEDIGVAAAKGQGLLEGKVVLITGARRGIGSTAARLLASQGAKVAVNFRRSVARAERVKEIIEAEGGVAELFPADVTDQQQVRTMVDAVLARFGRIDVLVSNAAIGFQMQPFVDHEWSDFQRKVNDEVAQLFFLCKAIVPGMLARGEGSIISVSSTMSKSHGAGFIAHSAAKAALDAFVRSLAAELGPDGIRVNTVAPGLIITDATANLPPAVKESAAAWSPLRRNGVARDVAGAILFFASDLSRFVTGGYQPVDGGMTML